MGIKINDNHLPIITLEERNLDYFLNNLIIGARIYRSIFLLILLFLFFYSEYKIIDLFLILLATIHACFSFWLARKYAQYFALRDYFIFERCNTVYDILYRVDMHMRQYLEEKRNLDDKNCLAQIEEAKHALKPLVYNSPCAVADKPALLRVWRSPFTLKGCKS